MTVALATTCAVTAFSCAYWLWAARTLRRRKLRTPEPSAAERLPVTVFRPMKPGVPHAAEILRETASALRPGDQALVGVSDPRTEQLARAVPALETIRCHHDLCPNPKVSKLIQMSPHAIHDRWCIFDSEARIAATTLDALASQLQPASPVTAAYRFSPPATLAEAFDRASTVLILWPGLAAARPGFFLGAAMCVTREHVASVGGWQSLADHLAEDHELGKRLASTGLPPLLADTVILLDGDPVSWRDAFAHQIRIAATYRAVTPAGYASMLLLCGLSASVAAALIAGGSWWFLPTATFAIRWATALHTAKTIAFPRKYLARAIALHAAAELPLWVAGWLARSITWAGKTYRIRNGRLTAAQSASPLPDPASPPAPANGNSASSPAPPPAAPSPDTATPN